MNIIKSWKNDIGGKQIFMMSQNNYVKNFLKFFICIIIVFSLINAVNANEYNIIENTTVIDENTQINNNFIETNNNYTL